MQVEFDFVKWASLFPKQKLALEASKSYRYVLYGGSMGSGKSYFLRRASAYHLLKLYEKYRIPGIKAAIFCEDYPALQDRHLSKVKFEFDGMGEWNESKHEFTLRPELGSGVIAFRNLDDPSKYLSSEFAIISVDELTKNPKSTFDILRTRMRWAGIEYGDTKFMGATNPVGEAWVKQYWVDRIYPAEEHEQDQFFYVPALPTDNPKLPAGYFDGLRSLPEAERKAFLEGDWNAFEKEMDEGGWMKLLTSAELLNAIIKIRHHTGVTILGVDPGAGGDESSIVKRSKLCAEVLFNQRLKDTMALVMVIVKFIEEEKPELVVIDIAGLGKPIYDRLQETRFRHLVLGVNFGSRAKDKDRYDLLKSELFYTGREWILKGGKLYGDPAWNELGIIKFKVDSERVIKLQPKTELLKAGLKSPNVADAFALTFAEDDGILQLRKEAEAESFNKDMFPKKPEYGFVDEGFTRLG